MEQKVGKRGRYYKATRLDGKDFASGMVQYEVGRTVRPIKYTGAKDSYFNIERPEIPYAVRGFCGPGYLHAATVPAETLVGGAWPCRLFVVEGVARAGLNEYHPHKAGFHQLTVIEEIEGWQALGPNGQEVAEHIQHCTTITIKQGDQLTHPWSYSTGSAAWRAARTAALSAARDAAGQVAWELSWRIARNAAGNYAGVAAGVAALALVVKDLISEDYFEALYKNWREVMG